LALFPLAPRSRLATNGQEELAATSRALLERHMRAGGGFEFHDAAR
jgi:hypothetical protein